MIGQKKSFLFFTIITLFASISTCFSLEGLWSAKPQFLLPNTTLSIEFTKQLAQNSTRIVYYMNIFACKIIKYKYVVVDNQIYFTFDEYSTQRTECQGNQLGFIRNKIDKVFYFYILANQLSFYGPNEKAILNMTRVATQYPKSLLGQWRSLDVDGQSIDEPITVTWNSFELCDGKGVVEYDIPSTSKPEINFEIKKVSGCSQNQIFTTLFKTKYFRWKNAYLLYFYDSDASQIMTIRKINDVLLSSDAAGGIKSSNQSSTVKTQDSSTKNNSQTMPPAAVVETTLKNNTSKDLSNSGSKQETINENKTVSTNGSNLNSKNNQSDSSSLNSGKTVTTDGNSSSGTGKTNPTTPAKVDNQTKTQNSQGGSKDTSKISEPEKQVKTSQPVKYQAPSQLPAINQSQFIGKWLIKDSAFDFSNSGYFFLIRADKILLYTGCNVYMSSYSLTQSTLDKIDVTSTSKTCPQIPQQAKILIEKFKSWKYLAYTEQGGKITMSAFDKNFSNAVQLQKV